MVSSDFRTEARKKLEGKWGKAACISLAYVAIAFVIGLISGLLPDSMDRIISLITTIIEIPLGFGLIISLMKLYNDEEIKAFDFIKSGFSNFAKSWKISLWIAVKMIIPIILMVVSLILISISTVMAIANGIYSIDYSSSLSFSDGSIALLIIGFLLLIVSSIWTTTKSYYYQLAYLIAIENEDLTAKESVEKSKELMKGNRWKLFVLQLTFIGWVILAAISFGIGLLWLVPYIQFAIIAFYKFLSGNNASDIKAEVVEENINNDDGPIKEQ